MSQRINQPVQSVRLTNVAVVRINRHGKRFEIACYRNKVVNYRQGLETDLSEVLQSDRIFTNVSKGQFAKSSELKKVFGTTDEEEVAKLILQKGDLQIGDKEREQFYENMAREIANWVAANCVNPSSQRPYTTSQIRNAMRQAEFRVNPNKATKPQCLECVKLLQSTDFIKIERAKMELCIKANLEEKENILNALEELQVTPSNVKEQGEECLITVLVDPSLYRPMDGITKRSKGRLEILRQVVTQEGDANLESEMQRKKQSNDTVATVSQVEQQLQETLQVSEKDDESENQEGEEVMPFLNKNQDTEQVEHYAASNTRKNQKKAQKQSKKAKRREKEEAAERQARIDAEKKRQEQRAMERGDVVDSGNGASQEQTQKSCNTCGGSFDTVALYRAHFRSDWHRYNVKLKMKGIPPVSEKEFLLCDSDAFFEDAI